jgi:RNA polymerase sigma-70 factor (ECF subfamily)
VTLADLDQDLDGLATPAGEGAVVFHMDEDAFRAFYDRTARALWAYLARLAGDRQLADDLLQETYYRFLRAGEVLEDESHRRAYLFRIATNLVRDARRRGRVRPPPTAPSAEAVEAVEAPDQARLVERRADLARALRGLKPRERSLLWLAYAQGLSHREIAAALALRVSSIKPLLFRARRKLAALLQPGAPRAAGR